MSQNKSLTVSDAIQSPDKIISQILGRPDTSAAWQGLVADVPTLRPKTEITAFVECVLIELRHEPVAARFQTAPDFYTRWLLCRTEHLSGTLSESFARMRFDRRHGVDIEPCSRAEAREGLCSVLSHSELGRVDVQPLAALSVGDR